MRLLLARRFGASSEKLPDGQLGLFNEAEAEAGEAPEADAGTEVAAHRRAAPKRAPLPDTLERVDIEHELAESERTCPHHGVELERFAEVVSEQLDIVPAKVRVLRHVRGKYRWPRHGDAVVSLNGAQLNFLLDGYDLWRMSPHRQVRYASMY